MTVENDADRAAFVHADDFGVAATYNPATGSPVTLNGVFDNNHLSIAGGGSVEVSSSDPRFRCREPDLPDVVAAEVDQITIASTSYTVVDFQPDGTGMTDLILTEV